MIDDLGKYLASIRTLTEAEVAARAASHDRFDLTPAERLENVSHSATYEGARH